MQNKNTKQVEVHFRALLNEEVPEGEDGVGLDEGFPSYRDTSQPLLRTPERLYPTEVQTCQAQGLGSSLRGSSASVGALYAASWI